MKYIDAEKLIAALEKEQQNIDEISAKHGGKNSFRMGRQAEVNSFRRIIDSLQQEQPERDLEEAAENSWVDYEYREDPRGLYSSCYIDAFKDGSKWQKRKMMKEAVDYKIVNNLAAYPVIYYEVNHLGLKHGDKVKIIIIKED